PGGIRIAHGNGPVFLQSADAVGNDAVLRPVATPDDVAGARAGDFYRMIFEKRTPPRADGDFRRRLAGTVRIVSAQRILLAITVEPLAILVAFVGRNQHGGAWFLQT